MIKYLLDLKNKRELNNQDLIKKMTENLSIKKKMNTLVRKIY